MLGCAHEQKQQKAQIGGMVIGMANKNLTLVYYYDIEIWRFSAAPDATIAIALPAHAHVG